jgi:hypothetical protein
MKKIVFATVLGTALLLASCVMNSGDSVPRIYIAGDVDDEEGIPQACYWVDGRRIMLENSNSTAQYIEVVDGRVVVSGFLNVNPSAIWEGGNPCYWMDGKRYEDYWERKEEIIRNGKEYTVSGSSIFIDGEKVIIDNFSVYAIYVSADGTVYAAGRKRDTDSGKYMGCYYVNGEFFELQNNEPDDYPGNITVSNGKVYIFHRNYYGMRDGFSYWVDGEKIRIDVPENHLVQDCAVANGKVCMVGGYKRGEQWQAWYWIDGVQYDLDGSYANAIYVEE